VLPFQDAAPTPASDWRHIIRFGRNVASYKFALGRVLLELGRQQQTFVPLDDLAVPYAAAICEHLIASHHPLRETLITQLGPDPLLAHLVIAGLDGKPPVVYLETEVEG
jgi:hypothetical protein